MDSDKRSHAVYIDVTDFDIDDLQNLRQNEDKRQVLLYMPALNFDAMHKLEACASSADMDLITVPITLPLMDITKQMEYAGIDMSADILCRIRDGIRKMIVDTLNKEELSC